ncbi:uncharacterized protein EI97DRAFT_366980 [Westerdykella ornata]|uniref:Mid2 domain-containing protein n=1 Tax=Westerdykella ornata TaxID=318751 RepID=A0A6A6JYE0_WESOR|nr:uncharacterized protein EI97DRAFT_366980 [Westerdykella ornata]KAF2280868.1 hypothetical protein EI97DRAFT_366980 [Westerdykella ornata]
MVLPKLSRLSILFFFATSQASSLFQRQDAVCGGLPGLSQCGGGLPSEFCCPKDSTCKRLNSADAISVICCPPGSDCELIQSIPCDIGLFDAKLHPDNQMHLANTTEIQLPKCGEKCCPFGYSCNGNACKANPSSAPSQSPSASPSTPPSTIRTPTSTPTPSQTPSASQTTDPATIVQTQRGFDGRSFVAGFFPGIVIGALTTLAVIWLIKKRREVQEKNRYSGDFGHVSRTISDPIYDPNYAARTDFIRRGSGSAQPSPNSTTGFVRKETTQSGGGMTPKIRSLWERTPKLGFSGFGGPLPAHPAPAVRVGMHDGRDPYKTPTRTPKRSDSISRTRISAIAAKNRGTTTQQRPDTLTRGTSTETIDVLMRTPSFLAPPKAPGMSENKNRLTQDSTNTTFTKLMERAGIEERTRNDVRKWAGSPGRAR